MPQTGNLSLVTTQQENPQYGQNCMVSADPTVEKKNSYRLKFMLSCLKKF